MTDENRERGFQAADEFKRLVMVRTGLSRGELQCPREQSEMTPCIARDGRLAVADAKDSCGVCVGCDHDVQELLKTERAKHPAN